MAQTQIPSTTAQSYTFGIEMELSLPESAIRDLGIQIGGYHHGIQLPHPFPQGWTAERDASVQATRAGHVPVEIVSPVLKGAEKIAEVKAVARVLRNLAAAVNVSCGLHLHAGVTSIVGTDYTAVATWVGKLHLLSPER